jgi:hypothetical protein
MRKELEEDRLTDRANPDPLTNSTTTGPGLNEYEYCTFLGWARSVTLVCTNGYVAISAPDMTVKEALKRFGAPDMTVVELLVQEATPAANNISMVLGDVNLRNILQRG